MGMRFEELRIEWKKLRMQDFLDSGEIKCSVFRPGMVALDQQCSQRQECKKDEILEFQTEAPGMGSTQTTITNLIEGTLNGV
jgi:hypothetical protein